MANGRNGAAFQMYREEELHKEAFLRFSNMEHDPVTRKLLLQLAEEEMDHAESYRKAAACRPFGSRKIDIYALLATRRLLGLGLTMKIMERTEKDLSSASMKRIGAQALPKIDERKENMLKTEIIGRNRVLNNIRDVFFGMSDGLVEVLAAVSGIGAALQQPLIVIVAGSIVAVSGTLSMAGGAYLSTDYENVVGSSKNRKYALKSPSKSAAYVGLAYIFGSAFPLLPFIFGATGVWAVAASVALTAAVLALTSVFLSIIGDTPITRRLVKTVAITLGIAAITISLGLFARYYLHVSI